ncbi:MAG: putative peptide zinc metalloprotease protein [Solirubrobacteraceae bacterium]|jgi:putative peptide zinc metalloprotease protein|nr:putative peptide zinc metalloprotease protein [Solirubrobacteraceae bacterium]
MRRTAALVVTFTLALAFPAVAGGPNNVVNASPTSDGAKVYRTGVKVTSTGADSITSTNLAFAHPSGCTGCEGIAAAYQAVIVTGNPSDVRPQNGAVAVNTDCTSCVAFAYAYQYVVSADRGTHLSSTGKARIKDIRDEANRLVRGGLTPTLDADLQALAVKFKAAVVDDLDRTGADPHAGVADADTDEAPAEG